MQKVSNDMVLGSDFGPIVLALTDDFSREAREIVQATSIDPLGEHLAGATMEDGPALFELATDSGWKVYNFEVADQHTYVADGVRVHNDSGFLGRVGNAIDDWVDNELLNAAPGSVADRITDMLTAPFHLVGTVLNAAWNTIGEPIVNTVNDIVSPVLTYIEETNANWASISDSNLTGSSRTVTDDDGVTNTWRTYTTTEGGREIIDVGNDGDSRNDVYADGSSTRPFGNSERTPFDDVRGQKNWEKIQNLWNGLTGQEKDDARNSSDDDDSGGGGKNAKPIVLDLDGDGVEITVDGSVSFDMDGDGFLEQTAWAAADDGFLVIDLNSDGSRGDGDGKIDQTEELVFTALMPDWVGATDLQVLSIFDQDLARGGNNDGVLSAADDVWDELAVWQDANQNGISDDGELKSLASLGISQINLVYDDGTDYSDPTNDIEIFGSALLGTASFIRDGAVVSGAVGDLSLRYEGSGWRTIETTEGYSIEFENGDVFSYLDVSLSVSPNVELLSGNYSGANGDLRDNQISAAGILHAVQIAGGDGNDVLIGGDGDDSLSGDLGSDNIFGGHGNDYIFVDAEDFIGGSVDGGSGYDTLFVVGDTGVVADLAASNIEYGYGGDGDDSLFLDNATFDGVIFGGGGRDIIRGGGSNDLLSGDDGHDVINGFLGDDRIFGGEGNDKVYGDNGDDALWGGIGQDTILGGTGDDSLDGDEGDDTLSGNNGDDTIEAGAGHDFVEGGLGDDFVNGGDGDDTILGHGDIADDDDTVFGGTGNDVFYDDRGDDLYNGGSGDDTFHIGALPGFDVVRGGTGFDTLILSGSQSDYRFFQLEGDSSIYNNADAFNIDRGVSLFIKFTIPNRSSNIFLSDVEVLQFEDGTAVDLSQMEWFFHPGGQNYLDYGTPGYNFDGGKDYSPNGHQNGYYWVLEFYNSFINLRSGHSVINLYSGDHHVRGGSGYDKLLGGMDSDTLEGGSGADFITGAEGSDSLMGQSGADTILGNVGTDFIDGGSGGDILSGGLGNDSIWGQDGSDSIWGDEGDDDLIGGYGADQLVGGDGNDWINAGRGADLLHGEAGQDTLLGGMGADELSGGEGDDSLEGNDGDDRLLGDQGNDILRGGTGFDSITGGTGGDTLFGDDGDDLLFGNEDDDSLEGGAGHDTLEGGLGADTLDGGSGGLDFVSYVNSAAAIDVNLEASTAAGGEADGDVILNLEAVRGSEFSDTIIGSNSGNVLMGHGGADTLEGGSGHDTLLGGLGDDSLSGGDDNDLLFGEDGNDVLSGGLGNDVFFGDAGADTVWAGAGDDSVEGGDGADRLLAGDGNDILDGGQGSDSIDGGAGDDTLLGLTGNDTLKGMWGADTLDGGLGDDLLVGGWQNDLLTGGLGADTFSFSGDIGTDVVTDFETNSDVALLNSDLWTGTSINDGAALFATFGTIVGNDVLIDFGGGNSVLFEEVLASSSLSDFEASLSIL